MSVLELERASVVSVSPETRVRWLAYRRAREAGYPDAETYDWALRPATRASLAAILLAYPELRPLLRPTSHLG